LNGLFIINFDDAGASQYTAYEDLVTKGEKATFYIIGSYIGNAGALSAAQLQTMSAAGMDIQCHTHDHANLQALSQAQVLAEYTDLNADFAAASLPAPRHTSYPYGASVDVETWTATLRDTGRSVVVGYVIPSSPKFGLKTYSAGWDTDYDVLKAAMLVAQINKHGMMLYSHGIGGSSIPRASFNDLIDYAQSIGMDIITVSELYALM
jgi:peptidoglycan/xylan/chitin deacetylase (PgdA/CDA1 family)